MRLICPNCKAEYEVPDGMVPAAGRHVQCAECHTRWFVAGVRHTPTEDQILRRLERVPPPRPAVVVAAPPEVADDPEPEPPAPRPREKEPVRPELVVVPSRNAGPAKPGERPTVARPAEVAPPPPPARPAPRLELAAEAPAPLPAALVQPPRRFGRGLLLALALGALALAGYHYRDRIADEVPVAAPALAAYGEAVDDLRAEVDERVISPLRKAVDPE
jgi:predicted Zn finger-like uncharacterized protein